MELTGEQGRNLAYGELDGWSEVPGTKKIVVQRRWLTEWEAVFEHAASHKYYQMKWDQGSTECQEDSKPFKYSTPTLIEVELREVTKKQWVPVKASEPAPEPEPPTEA